MKMLKSVGLGLMNGAVFIGVLVVLRGHPHSPSTSLAVLIAVGVALYYINLWLSRRI